MRGSVRLGVAAASCVAAAVGLSGCGDRISATRTFSSVAVSGFHLPPPPAAGSYEILEGPLTDARGAAVPGTKFYQSCFFKGGGVQDPGPYPCTGYVNTGHNTYAFSGSSPNGTDGTFNSAFQTGSTGRVVVSAGGFAVNSKGQNVRDMLITLKP